jgi:hypothetical protein
MKRVGVRAVIWTLPAASAIHHTEELLFSRDRFPVPDDVIGRWPPWIRPLLPTTYGGYIAWSAIDVILGTAVSALATSQEPPRWASRLSGIAAILGATDAVDHATQWVAKPTYNPGLATSTFRLPHSMWTLRRLVEADRIDRRWLRRVLWITTPLPALMLALSVVVRVVRPLLPPEGEAVGEMNGGE